MKIVILSTLLFVMLIAPGQIFAQKNILIIDGKRYELAPGPSYYDAHPEERIRDDAIQANKPLVDMQQKLMEDIRAREQGYGGEIYRDYPIPSSSPSPLPSPPIRTDNYTPLYPNDSRFISLMLPMVSRPMSTYRPLLAPPQTLPAK